MLYKIYSDDELLRALKQDDEYAFREIYERFSEGLSARAVKLTEGYDEANDVVQEVFISIWNNRRELKITINLHAYLYSAVRYGCFRALENTKRRKSLLNSLASYMSDPTSCSNHLETKELETSLGMIVRRMPERMREVYILSREEKLSHKEIGRQLNIAEDTSKKQIKKALRFIRLQLGLLSGLLFFGPADTFIHLVALSRCYIDLT